MQAVLNIKVGGLDFKWLLLVGLYVGVVLAGFRDPVRVMDWILGLGFVYC